MDKTIIKDDENFVFYRRHQFSTRLPKDRVYMASHFWLKPVEDDCLQIGFTQFATRMLGDLVEHGFEVSSGDAISEGKIIGWVEGMKAAADLFCMVDGEFLTGNPLISEDIDLIRTKPYAQGWLYEAKAKIPDSSFDVQGYVNCLETTIDQIQGQYPDD